MEVAPTPLHQSNVRVVGERLVVDGLVVEDATAVRLATEAPDAAQLLLDAIEVGARILDREQVGANADFVKAEFEKAARDLDAEFVDRARRVAERLDQRLDEAFGPEHGVVVNALKRHFGDESTEAVQHKVRDVVREMAGQMREDLRRQFASEGDENPLASFHRVQLAVAKQVGEQHAVQLNAVREQIEAMRLEVERLRAEKDKLEEVAAERDKGTAKGRTFEEVVHEALDRIALAQGDDCEAVGDFLEGTGKKGDVVVGIAACHGPARGRIVFEVKTSRLSKPKAIEELDRCMAERNADYGVLVVPAEDRVPAKMVPLREYNGDKLIVAFDPEDGAPLGLQVAYTLARARVLMTKGGGDGVDTAAVRDAVERALGLMEDVRRIKQQLTASKTSIDKAGEIVGAMADGVRGQLAEIAGLIDRAEAAAGEEGEADLAPSPPASADAPARPAAAAAPRLRDELAAAVPAPRDLGGEQSTLL
jgi:hypothetical protein